MAKPPQNRATPPVRKGLSFPFQVSVACWIDLLGYGGMMANADFNPLHPKAKEALSRLRRFHEIVARHSVRNFPTLVMNDGAAAYRDLSLRTNEVTYDFLIRSWKLFAEIQSSENSSSYPGARLVLASGFRMRGRRAGIDAASSHLKSIFRRFESGEMDAQQAIHEAARMQPKFDIVPQLQANFAFTKAYIAENSGQSGGLAGPNFFLNLVLFESGIPEWIESDEIVEWSDPRLKLFANFAVVNDILGELRPANIPGEIIDGLQVAQRLAGNPNVLDALRTSQKP